MPLSHWCPTLCKAAHDPNVMKVPVKSLSEAQLGPAKDRADCFFKMIDQAGRSP